MTNTKHTPGPRDEQWYLNELENLAEAAERLVSISACQHWGACNRSAPDGIDTKPHPIEEACPACHARAAIARAKGEKS